MKRVFINNDNLNKSDLDYEVIRVKGIIINEKDEVLIAHNNNTFQFVGGHLREEEDMEEALLREILEETGILIDDITGPFMLIEAYYKNYFNTSKNVHSKIYYYKLFTDKMPDLSKTNYDILERQTDFKLFYVPVKNIKLFLDEGLKNKMIDKSIYDEMLLVIDEYNRIFGGVYY